MAKKLSRRSFLEVALAGGALRNRQSDHHEGCLRAGIGADRHRPSLRSHRRDLVVGLLARQGREGGGRHHQSGRRHRRPQGRTGDRRYRIQSGHRRAQAAQPHSALERGVRGRIGAFGRHARGDPDRFRAQDDLFLDRRSDRSDRLERHALFVPHRHRHLLHRRGQHAVGVRELRQGLDDHLRRLRLGPEHRPGIEGLHRARRRQGAQEHRCAARYQGLRALSRADFRPTPKCCCRPSSARCRSPSTPRPRTWASTRR